MQWQDTRDQDKVSLEFSPIFAPYKWREISDSERCSDSGFATKDLFWSLVENGESAVGSSLDCYVPFFLSSITIGHGRDNLHCFFFLSVNLKIWSTSTRSSPFSNWKLFRTPSSIFNKDSLGAFLLPKSWLNMYLDRSSCFLLFLKHTWKEIRYLKSWSVIDWPLWIYEVRYFLPD